MLQVASDKYPWEHFITNQHLYDLPDQCIWPMLRGVDAERSENHTLLAFLADVISGKQLFVRASFASAMLGTGITMWEPAPPFIYDGWFGVIVRFWSTSNTKLLRWNAFCPHGIR